MDKVNQLLPMYVSMSEFNEQLSPIAGHFARLSLAQDTSAKEDPFHSWLRVRNTKEELRAHFFIISCGLKFPAPDIRHGIRSRRSVWFAGSRLVDLARPMGQKVPATELYAHVFNADLMRKKGNGNLVI